MEEAVRAYGPAVDGKPAELTPMQRYPGQFAFVHERLEVMDAKLERVRRHPPTAVVAVVHWFWWCSAALNRWAPAGAPLAGQGGSQDGPAGQHFSSAKAVTWSADEVRCGDTGESIVLLYTDSLPIEPPWEI
jgi:hypothetical protein